MCLVWNSSAQVRPDQCVCVAMAGFLSPLLTVYIPINYCNSDIADHPLTRNVCSVCSLLTLGGGIVINFRDTLFYTKSFKLFCFCICPVSCVINSFLDV